MFCLRLTKFTFCTRPHQKSTNSDKVILRDFEIEISWLRLDEITPLSILEI